MPRPVRMRASIGSAAASPQTRLACRCSLAADVTISIMRRSAGCHGSFSVARGADCRSAAKIYWARSFVPMLTKSTSAKNQISLEGGSRSFDHDPMIGKAAACAASAKLRISATVVIMGAMTRTSAISDWQQLP